MKRVFKMKSKAFFIIFKQFLLKQIKQFFLEGESLTLNEINVGKPRKKFSFIHLNILSLPHHFDEL